MAPTYQQEQEQRRPDEADSEPAALSGADREWIRRQARAARALAAEQRRWMRALGAAAGPEPRRVQGP